MKVLKWMDEHLEETLVAVLLSVLVLLMFVQVVLRYVFASGFSWSEVIARFLMVLMGFISLGYGIRHRSHIKIDMLLTILPRTIQKICEVLVWLITFGVLLALFYTSVHSAIFYMDYGRIIPGTGIQMYIIYILGPVIGCGLGFIRILQIPVLDFIKWKKQRAGKLTDEEGLT